MIKGVGTDIVSVSRIQDMIDRHGDKFARRILGDEEYPKYLSSYNKKAYLAKRFAAKEALSKAFGTGFRDGLLFSHIQVVNNSLGKPEFVLKERALELKAQLGVKTMHLSVSDEKEFAVAFVVMED